MQDLDPIRTMNLYVSLLHIRTIELNWPKRPSKFDKPQLFSDHLVLTFEIYFIECTKREVFAKDKIEWYLGLEVTTFWRQSHPQSDTRSPKDKQNKNWVSICSSRQKKNCEIVLNIVLKWKDLGKNRCKSTKMSQGWEKMETNKGYWKGNRIQSRQLGKVWGPATHSSKYETRIMGPGCKPVSWPPPGPPP